MLNVGSMPYMPSHRDTPKTLDNGLIAAVVSAAERFAAKPPSIITASDTDAATATPLLNRSLTRSVVILSIPSYVPMT